MGPLKQAMQDNSGRSVGHAKIAGFEI